ncbi:hypothetical protein [Paraburkholderia tropica]|uniref:hypothetical protein n=1 Tax=Paraburkholderia tropica TaxID=92647 RepID=UPI0007EDC56C|nr:hypothetical protein [Paraburkholderia tropica]OBR54139.1 hypothetical protein A6456_37730 [Paraburkholderia tropica]
MSTREKFEKWITTVWRPDDGAELLKRGFPHFAFAAWQAGRAVALEEALTAVIEERLEDPSKNADDIAYDMAVDDCANAVRVLAKEAGC